MSSTLASSCLYYLSKRVVASLAPCILNYVHKIWSSLQNIETQLAGLRTKLLLLLLLALSTNLDNKKERFGNIVHAWILLLDCNEGSHSFPLFLISVLSPTQIKLQTRCLAYQLLSYHGKSIDCTNSGIGIGHFFSLQRSVRKLSCTETPSSS